MFTSDNSTDDGYDDDEKEFKGALFEDASKSNNYSYLAKRNNRGEIIGKMRENFQRNQDKGNSKIG